MPFQNRMDPSGQPHVVDARGTCMGNRGGRLHDPASKALLNPGWTSRRWINRRWIICRLDFNDRHRDVWGGGYTEFFFLDEVTALAAGHRPCFECRRQDAARFMNCVRQDPTWHGLALGTDAVDRMLHTQRIAPKRPKAKDHPGLPDGTVLQDGASFLTRQDATWLRWDHAGWQPGPVPSTKARIVTPAITIAALRSGYKPIIVLASDRTTHGQ
jgi:hypothetical protein